VSGKIIPPIRRVDKCLDFRNRSAGVGEKTIHRSRQLSLVLKGCILRHMSSPPAHSDERKLAASEALKQVLAGHAVKGQMIADIDWSNTTFSEPVSFSQCSFKMVDLSHSRFQKGLEFVGCVFEGSVSFEGARVDGDCQFRACRFCENARFDRLQVNGKLEVRAPRDKTVLANGPDPLVVAAFLKAPYVTFKKDTSFSQIRVSGEANFGSAQFYGSADFYNARIAGPAFFRIDYCKLFRETGDKSKSFPDEIFPPVRFGEDPQSNILVRNEYSQEKTRCRFRDAYFGGELNFHGAIFRVKADFSYLHCQGAAFFCFNSPERTEIPCVFKSEVDFEGARFSTTLRLDEAVFSNEAVSFRDCRIVDDLGFGSTIPAALFLTGCRYKRILGASHEVLVKKIKKQELLAETNRRKRISDAKESLKKATAKLSGFETTQATLPQPQPTTGHAPSETTENGKDKAALGEKSAELKSVQERATRELLKAKNAPTAFDRSSWIQLESALRSDGDDQFADDVYRNRMRQERKLARPWWRRPTSWLWDITSSYGTSARRLVFWCALVFLIGAFIFSLGTLRENRESKRNATTAMFQPSSSSSAHSDNSGGQSPERSSGADAQAARGNVAANQQRQLPHSLSEKYHRLEPAPGQREHGTPDGSLAANNSSKIDCGKLSDKEKHSAALIISLINFSPIKLPIDNDCEPAGSFGIGIAALEKIVGFILVPLLIANLSGILNRRAKAKSEAGAGEE
jgi:hypothetical protein